METFEQNGQKYLRLGDRAIPFDEVDAEGKPIIKPIIETVEHADGRRDVTVKVPYLTISNKVTN